MNATAQLHKFTLWQKVHRSASQASINMRAIFQHGSHPTQLVKLQLRSEGIKKLFSVMAMKIVIHYNWYLFTDVCGQGGEGVAVSQLGLPGCREQPCCSRSSHMLPAQPCSLARASCAYKRTPLELVGAVLWTHS